MYICNNKSYFSSLSSAVFLYEKRERNGQKERQVDLCTSLFAHSGVRGTRAGTGESITDRLASKIYTKYRHIGAQTSAEGDPQRHQNVPREAKLIGLFWGHALASFIFSSLVGLSHLSIFRESAKTAGPIKWSYFGTEAVPAKAQLLQPARRKTDRGSYHNCPSLWPRVSLR